MLLALTPVQSECYSSQQLSVSHTLYLKSNIWNNKQSNKRFNIMPGDGSPTHLLFPFPSLTYLPLLFRDLRQLNFHLFWHRSRGEVWTNRSPRRCDHFWRINLPMLCASIYMVSPTSRIQHLQNLIIPSDSYRSISTSIWAHSSIRTVVKLRSGYFPYIHELLTARFDPTRSSPFSQFCWDTLHHGIFSMRSQKKPKALFLWQDVIQGWERLE